MAKKLTLTLVGALLTLAIYYVVKNHSSIFSFFDKQTKIHKELTFTNRPSHFHPDTVQGFTWTVGDKKWVFSRATKNATWNPLPRSRFIEDFLGKTSLLEYQPLKSEKAKAAFSISFFNQQTWDGEWDGQSLLWVSGPFAGQGAVIQDTEFNLKLNAGIWAFYQNKWSWCVGAVDRIAIQTGSTPPHELSGYKLQNWLGQNCDIEVDHFIDTENFSVKSKATSQVEIYYSNGTRDSFEFSEQTQLIDWSSQKPPYNFFRSQDLISALIQITIDETTPDKIKTDE